MPRKLHRDIGIPHFDAAGQPRLRFQAPGVIELVVLFVIGLFQRGSTRAYVDMAGGTRGDHLASVLNRHTGFEQALAQRGTAFDFEVAPLGAQIGVRH